MLSYLNMRANIALFHFSFSIRCLVPLLFTPPSPSIPIYNQPSRIESVFITSFLNFSGRFGIVFQVAKTSTCEIMTDLFLNLQFC